MTELARVPSRLLIRGTEDQPGLPRAPEGVVAYADGVGDAATGLDAIVDGDENGPGMTTLVEGETAPRRTWDDVANGSMEENACALAATDLGDEQLNEQVKAPAPRRRECPSRRFACPATSTASIVARDGLHTVVDGDGTAQNPGPPPPPGRRRGATAAADGADRGRHQRYRSFRPRPGTRGHGHLRRVGSRTAFGPGTVPPRTRPSPRAANQLATGACASADGAGELAPRA